MILRQMRAHLRPTLYESIVLRTYMWLSCTLSQELRFSRMVVIESTSLHILEMSRFVVVLQGFPLQQQWMEMNGKVTENLRLPSWKWI